MKTYKDLCREIVAAIRARSDRFRGILGFEPAYISIIATPCNRRADEWLGGLSVFGLRNPDGDRIDDIAVYEARFPLKPGPVLAFPLGFAASVDLSNADFADGHGYDTGYLFARLSLGLFTRNEVAASSSDREFLVMAGITPVIRFAKDANLYVAYPDIAYRTAERREEGGLKE